MARPVVAESAEQLYEALGAYTAPDEALGWPLLNFCEAITDGLGLEAISDYVSETDDGLPGWGVLFDPDLCPPAALQYLAQFVGVQFAPSLSEAEQRAALIAHEGWRRGTPAAIVSATQRTLNGAKTVIVNEREGGAYRLQIRTLLAETPDPVATEAAVRTQKPIGIVLDYSAIDGEDWGDVEDDFTTWGDVEDGLETWGDVEDRLP